VSDTRGFALIDVLMEGVAVVGVLAMTAIATVQVLRAVTGVSEARAEARYELLRSDLDELRARQAIHYADALTYSSSEDELRFTASPGVLVRIVASGWGWAAEATHPGLEEGAGCAIQSGHIASPSELAVPAPPGEVVCTD
jgi:Tfp pilus assembly protein PilV